MSVNIPEAEVVRLASLIIWDETPMTNRYAFEALDRTMRDIMQSDSVFGGKVILFGGDFRQNMRVNEVNGNTSQGNFCNWLLDVGNGTTADNDSDEYVKLPEHMLMQNSGLQNLFSWVYRGTNGNSDYVSFFKGRAILAPRNREGDAINECALTFLQGKEVEYMSRRYVSWALQEPPLHDDPPLWIGPLSTHNVIHLIEDFEIVRHQYYGGVLY
ncbi:hypothetical protein L7F22_063588 [Adiantum nelumboides]|nr:hypothetical protein [Adiantum nelumboides]